MTGEKYYETEDFKLAVCLASLGIPFKNEMAGFTLAEKNRERSTFCFELDADNSAGISRKELVEAYTRYNDDQKLDELMDKLVQEASHGGKEGLVECALEIQRLIPLAMICYMRGVLENRTTIATSFKRETRMVYTPHRKGFVVMSTKAPDHVKRRLLK